VDKLTATRLLIAAQEIAKDAEFIDRGPASQADLQSAIVGLSGQVAKLAEVVVEILQVESKG